MRVRKERDQAIDLFEEAMQRVRVLEENVATLEETVALQKERADSMRLDTDEQNDDLQNQVQ